MTSRTFKLSLITILLSLSTLMSAQVGIGFVTGIDLYQRYSNPIDNIANESSGNALLNVVFGPKVWVGGKDFSISAELPASIGITGFDVKDYKGMGLASLPLIGMINFKGNSGLDRDVGLGFSIGGGVMRYKTELYGLTQEYADLGVVRDWEQVYVIQAEIGFGVTGFTGKLYTRYGFSNDDEKLRTFSIGILTDFNLLMMRKIDDPASAL